MCSSSSALWHRRSRLGIRTVVLGIMYVSFQDDGQVHNLLTLYPDFTSKEQPYLIFDSTRQKYPLFVCFMNWVDRGYLLINLSNTYIINQ